MERRRDEQKGRKERGQERKGEKSEIKIKIKIKKRGKKVQSSTHIKIKDAARRAAVLSVAPKYVLLPVITGYV